MSRPLMNPFPGITRRAGLWDTCLSKIRAHRAKETAITLTITIIQLFNILPQLDRPVISSRCHQMAPSEECVNISTSGTTRR